MATTQQILADYAAIDYTPPYALAGQPTATLPAAPDPTLVAAYQPLTNDAVISAIEGETYTLVTVDAVIREYQGAFGTVPDQAGVAFWVHAIDNGTASLATLSIAFADSPQFATLYGGANATTPANTTLVTAMYQNVLQRAPDAAGLAFWIGSGLNAAQLLQVFTQAAEAINLFAPHIVAFQNLEAAGVPALVPVPPTSIFSLATPLTLTTGIDFPTQGFTTGSGGTATTAGAIFQADPVAGVLGLNNTLNTGDNLVDTFSAKDGTLNVTDVAATVGLLANPPFALGVTTTGISTLNITNDANILGLAIKGGFQGSITDLTTVSNNNSVAPVQLGGTGQGLNTLLTNYNINNYAGPAEDAFVNIIKASAGDATKTINIGIKGALGTTKAGAASEIVFSNDVGGGTAANPNLTYGTWSITSNSNTFAQLEQDFTEAAVGIGAAKALVLSGTNAAATVAVGADFAGDWQLLQSIDASGQAGTVVITGATSGAATQAFASTANPGWLFGSDAGLLDTTGSGGVFSLTSVKLGSGTTFLDVSSASAAQVAALTTTPGTLVALNNEIIVNDAVATTTSAATFANIKGFEILGVAGAAGTINDANLPTSINEIIYQTAAVGAVTITNQVNPLEVNTEDNGKGFALTSTGTGFSDSFTLDIGNPLHNTLAFPGSGAGAVGALTLNADSIVNINALGQTTTGPAITDTLGFVTLNPALGGNEVVTIGGNTALVVGTTATGAIADFTGGLLNINNMTITDNNTSVVTLVGSSAGPSAPFASLDFVPPGDSQDIGFSTNAVVIDATKSGGIIMQAGDANYVTSATVAGSAGDVFKGSTTAGDVFGGSIGNDSFTLQQGGAAETIYTGGGKDTITLFSGHGGADHIEFYAGFQTGGVTPGGVEIPKFLSITEATDVAQLGWWGLATGATELGYNATGTIYAGLAANTGTSADMSELTSFTGSDTLDFGANSGTGHGAIWGSGGADGFGGTAHGLTTGNFTSTVAAAGGTAAVVQEVNPGNTVNAGTTLIELTTGTFADANAVANALHNLLSYNITFGAALASHDSAHMLIAYQDLGGSTRIADLAISNTTGVAAANSAVLTEHVSDIVHVAGQQLASVVGHVALV